MWPFKEKIVNVKPASAPKPPEQITFSASDDPMTRARNVFRTMGMFLRTDAEGELLLRRTADALKIYSDLDFKNASYIICGKAEGKETAPTVSP